MKTRIISALVLLPAFIFILYKGGAYLAGFVLLASLLGVNEFCNALKEYSSKNTKVVLFIATVLQMGLFYMGYKEYTVFIAMIVLFFSAMQVVFEKIQPFDAAMSIFTFFYVSVSLSYVYLLSSEYRIYFWYIFIIAMITDTFAYFTGYFFGKHKLSKISPKKTIEGSIGGIVFCTIACVIYAYYFQSDIIKYIIPFAIIGSVISQIGDIFASSFKRLMDIKDYSNLIPGHGGILDRADSIILTAPYVFMFASLMDKLK